MQAQAEASRRRRRQASRPLCLVPQRVWAICALPVMLALTDHGFANDTCRGPRCSRLRTGFGSSISGNTLSALPRMTFNFAILADLTDQDLKEMGVTSLGHRRQLLPAITELKGGETGTPKPSTEDVVAIRPHDTAERRQVTVMFSDLVGSTALSARMDPEDLREVISSCQTCVAETVGHFGGFVAKYMGDGVLIYFGYPQAHEDDAERADSWRAWLAETAGCVMTLTVSEAKVV